MFLTPAVLVSVALKVMFAGPSYAALTSEAVTGATVSGEVAKTTELCGISWLPFWSTDQNSSV